MFSSPCSAITQEHAYPHTIANEVLAITPKLQLLTEVSWPMTTNPSLLITLVTDPVLPTPGS